MAMAPFKLALNRAGGYPVVMDCTDSPAQGSYWGRKAWRGGAREWGGHRSDRKEPGARRCDGGPALADAPCERHETGVGNAGLRRRGNRGTARG